MTTPVDAAHAELRAWIKERYVGAHPTATVGLQLAISTSALRARFFGVDDSLKHYPARDLAYFQLMSRGEEAEYFLKVAFGRAIAENDLEFIDRIEQTSLIGDYRNWRRVHLECPEDRLGELGSLAAADPQERAMARLIVARRFPHRMQAGWLEECPSATPQIGHALAMVMATRQDLHERLEAHLAANPEVLLTGEPDEILAPYAATAAAPPQHSLRRFEGLYGERTVVAAAEWHLEHREPRAALQLVATIRPLSVHADRAHLIGVMACLDLADGAAARACAAAIDDPALAGEALLRIAETDGAAVDAEAIVAVADGCGRDRPELFYRCLRWLLARKRLDAARDLARRKSGEFSAHPEVRQVIDVLLGASRAAK